MPGLREETYGLRVERENLGGLGDGAARREKPSVGTGAAGAVPSDHVGAKLNEAELRDFEALAAKRNQTQAELIRGLILREIEQGKSGPQPSVAEQGCLSRAARACDNERREVAGCFLQDCETWPPL